MMINNLSFFWKDIGEEYRSHKKDFKNFEKNIPIINLDNKRSLIYANSKIHFYNGEIIITPREGDILRYDEYLSTIIGKASYDVITDIFRVCNLQIKKEDEKNELDDIVDKLKKGEYGDIEESNYWFIDNFPYIKSASFYCRDISMPEENKKFFPNYGGRCVELFSDKKIIIDGVPIEQADIKIEMERLKEKNLGKIMEPYGIPSNRCLCSNRKEKDTAQKDILDSWLN